MKNKKIGVHIILRYKKKAYINTCGGGIDYIYSDGVPYVYWNK